MGESLYMFAIVCSFCDFQTALPAKKSQSPEAGKLLERFAGATRKFSSSRLASQAMRRALCLSALATASGSEPQKVKVGTAERGFSL